MKTLVCTDCATANINAEADESVKFYPAGTTFEERPEVVMFSCDSCNCTCFGQPMQVEFYEPANS